MKKKKINISKYNKIMEKIVAKGRTVSETLIEMLNEASKYILTNDKKRKKK